MWARKFRGFLLSIIAINMGPNLHRAVKYLHILHENKICLYFNVPTYTSPINDVYFNTCVVMTINYVSSAKIINTQMTKRLSIKHIYSNQENISSLGWYLTWLGRYHDPEHDSSRKVKNLKPFDSLNMSEHAFRNKCTLQLEVTYSNHLPP